MTLSIQLVLSNLVVASLIGGVAWVVGRSGRRAALAHVLWIVFFVKLVTPPIIVLPLLNVSDSLQSASAIAQGSWSNQMIDIWIVFGVVWAIGFLLIATRGLVRFLKFRQLVCREGVRDVDAEASVMSLLIRDAQQWGDRVRSVPHVLRVPVRVSPMLFGVGWCPVIVCPDQLWQVLSDDEREAFLAHETAHYCRRDHWVRWLEWMVTAVYWWFPGVHWARRQLERHEEACCDAWAVRRLESTPRKYAEALLRVVDFISDNGVATPRLASAMQPTDSLEERIRLLMRHRGMDDASHPTKWFAGAACFVLWLVHPISQPRTPIPVTIAGDLHRSTTRIHTEIDVMRSTGVLGNPLTVLPESPTGFWNRSPRNQWANFSLALPGAELFADVRHGISVNVDGRDPVHFTHDELTSLVEIPLTHRIVIGDRSGNLRLWDFSDSMPVSLIGRHRSGITSLAFHHRGGLVSADQTGSVMRWNIQSGQVLATWSTQHNGFSLGSVQSVRYSNDGQTLAILVGRWHEGGSGGSVHILSTETLEVLRSLPVACGTAAIIPDSDGAWLSVDWTGVVRLLDSQLPIHSVSKDQVSALVLSANYSLPKFETQAD